MSTTTPIDVERYLLEGVELEPTTPQAKRLPTKPNLNDALREHYNRTAPQGSRILAPGEVPEPVSTEVQGPPAPGIVDRIKQNLPSMPSISPSGIATRAGEAISRTVSPLVPDTSRIAPTTPAAPLTPTDPLAAAKVPGETPRRPDLIRDLGEAAYTITRDVMGGLFGAATFASDVMNTTLARVARGGPFAGGPESPTHYRDLFKEMQKTVNDIRYEPQSDIAKSAQKAVGGAAGIVSDIAELATKPIAHITGMDEDHAKVLAFAAELYAFYKLDAGIRKAAPALRSKLADFANRTSKMKSDADYFSSGADKAAMDVYTVVKDNPAAQRAIGEARQKLIGEAGAPSPEGGPAPGGAKVDPADLQVYKDTLRTRADELRKQGAGPTRIQNELNAIPKPQPRETPVAPESAPPVSERFPRLEPEDIIIDPTSLAYELQRYRAELDNRAAEFKAAHPEGYTELALRKYLARVPRPSGLPRPTLATEFESRVAPIPTQPEVTAQPRAEDTLANALADRAAVPEVVVGQETAVARPVPPEVAPTPAATVQPRTTGVNIPAEVAPTPQARAIPLVPSAAPETPVEAAATVAPEVVPAPPLGDTPAVAAVPTFTPQSTGKERLVSTDQYADAARTLLNVANSPHTPSALRRETLRDIKTLARSGGKSVAGGLRDLGFTPEEVRALDTELKSVRARKNLSETLDNIADKPAVQTAATEAVLETAPAGTEVEIPAPAEPVVDTSPAVAKPKRKRRVVKASTPETEAYAEGEIALQRGVRDQQENQRAYIEQQLQGTNISLADAERILKESFDRGMRPNEAFAALGERVNPDAALNAANVAFDLYVKGSPINRPTISMSGGSQGFTEISTVAGLNESARASTLPSRNTAPIRAAMQVRTTGGKPDAIFIDTTGMNSRTSLADIERQVQRGQTSPDVAQALRGALQRQADIAGLPIERAQEFNGQELMREATRIAAETGIDLYVKKGKNYELVPKDVVRTDARLNRGDDLAPTPISKDAAGAYVESKTSDIGPAQVREIMDAIEKGVDITDRLPSDLIPHYKQMLEADRAGIDTSERRAFIDILNDLNTMLGEEGAIGGNFTRAQRMAAQRLQADMRKAGKTVREFLFGARPEDVAMFEQYLDTINNPVPPNSTNPRNMRFDPENKIRGDRVVKHRVISSTSHLEAPPLWDSEVKGIQNARDIEPGGTPWDLKLPLRQHKKAGTEFLYYAYRTAQKNLNAELSTLHSDMQELSRGFSSRSLENIGANGYARQGGDGQRILTYNKVTPRPLSPAERRLQTTIDGIYAATFDRINETREATGREPLTKVDDYQTFARTISLLNHLGIKVDLARATTAEVNAAYLKHKSTNFPYIVRKHAFYTAEMNALKILDTYMQSALKDIHMSPFLAKVHELIETNLPDPVTGKETWSLKEHKEGLYNELRTWTDYIATGTNWRIPDKQRIIIQTLNRNIAYSMLSGLLRSAGIQISTLVNTQQALGPIATFNGVVANLADHLSGGKRRQFALDNSEILSSRKFIDAYNEVAGAVIGRRPRDFFHAIRTGAIGDIQQVAGRAGFKLMELMDMEAAVMAWNAAYKQSRSHKMGYNHKDAVRFADDVVVRTQGSTMPGDLSGIQRNAAGKMLTQFQTFLISDWNFLTNEVLSKGKVGGGGGGQIPPGGVSSGSGSWETGGPRSTFQMIKNITQLLIATQLMNEFFKLLHIQPAQPDPVKDIQQGMKEGDSALGLALRVGVGQAERIPIVGAMRYGKGMFGPFSEISRDLVRSYRGDPMAPEWWEPTGQLSGVPGVRQISKTVRGIARGESAYDSLMGWYSEEGTGGTPTRENRSQQSRSRSR